MKRKEKDIFELCFFYCFGHGENRGVSTQGLRGAELPAEMATQAVYLKRGYARGYALYVHLYLPHA